MMPRMNKNNWPYPGARWWKFDFHTHTPVSRDTCWFKQGLELSPQDWLLKYMAAEIDCVAITDHNSGEWIDKLKAAYAEMKNYQPAGFRELHLFPGVEISIQGGFHLLAIFDESTKSGDIDTLLGKVDYDGTKGDSDGVTRKGAAEAIQAILDSGGLPIPAHVDDSKNGLLRLIPGSTTKAALDVNTLRQILAADILAMEVVKKTSPLPVIYHENRKAWTPVVGSDCHNFKEDYENLPGSRYTWIKMARPSLEGLRLALLDGEGVSVRRSDTSPDFKPFKTPEHFIESISISEAHAMGRRNPAILQFSPYFNAIIGGRGTGKSTVVHALRLAYRREEDLPEKSEPRKTFDSFRKHGIRADTEIMLTLSRDGISHQLRCRQDGQGIAVEVEGQPATSQSITPERFPVSLFSQGQIAALVGDDNQWALLEIIDQAAGTAIQKKAFEDAKSTFLASCSKQRELQSKLKEHDAINIELEDTNRKLQRFEETHSAEILKIYQRANRQEREINLQFERATELANLINALADELLPENIPDGLFNPIQDKEALSTINRLTAAIADAQKQVKQTANHLTETGAAIKAELQATPWRQTITQAHTAYETLIQELRGQGIGDPAAYGRIMQNKQRLEMEVKRLDAIQKQHDDLLPVIKSQFSEIEKARLAITETRREFLRKTLADNDFVRITLRPYGCESSDMERDLRQVLGMPDRFDNDIEGLKSELGECNGDAGRKYEDIRAVREKLINGCRGQQSPLGGNIRNRLQTTAESKPEYCDHISCWFPEDGLQVKYSRKGDGKEFKPIAQASAGQRAAAMLAFLLAYGDEPLILDQPEDDLDNHLIYNLIVEQIRAHKQRRQLIVVTHNPNIVVNGDAEMVYALDFNHQCYVKEEKSGSLQEEAVRKEVCQIMEGGQEAFERRWRRLGRET
jgi:DNA repair ATPase RecN